MSARRDRVAFWDADSWVRYDSEHYLAIARSGYELSRCHPDSPYGGAAWCGNTAWFPGYAGLIRLFDLTGLSGPAAGLLVAAIAHLLTLLVVSYVLRELSWPRRAVILGLVALAPGSVYHHAVFPISLLALLSLASLVAASADRWGASAALGGLAASSYSTGFLLAPVLVLSSMIRRRGMPAPGALLAAAGTSAGLLAVWVFQWWQVGDGRAFFKVQEKYGHGFHSPLRGISRAAAEVMVNNREWIAWQTLLVAALMVTLLVGVAARRIQPNSLDTFLITFATAYWLFPLTVGGTLSLYRAESVLLPAMMLVRRLPVPFQLLLAVLLAHLDYRMGVRFFRGVLI